MTLTSIANDAMLCLMDTEPVTAILAAIGHVPKEVIEVGAASGKLSIRLGLHGSHVFLVDHDPDMIQYEMHLVAIVQNMLAAAHEDPDRLRVEIAQMDGRDLSGVATGAVELAWNEGVIEHLPWTEQVTMLREMARASRDYVAFIVPDATNPENQRIAAEVHHAYHGLTPTETPLRMEDAVSLAEKAGLTVVHTQPILERLLLVVCRKQVRKVVEA